MIYNSDTYYWNYINFNARYCFIRVWSNPWWLVSLYYFDFCSQKSGCHDKMWLMSGVACCGIWVTIGLLANYLEPCSVKSSFSKYLLHLFWLVWKPWMIWWECHWFLFLVCGISKPPVLKSCLSATRIEIHSHDQQSISGISSVTLRVIDHN